jgi:hypothetical protein
MERNTPCHLSGLVKDTLTFGKLSVGAISSLSPSLSLESSPILLLGTRVGMQFLSLELLSSLEESAANSDFLRVAHLTAAASRETCSVHTKYWHTQRVNEFFFKLHNINFTQDTVGDI